MHMLAAYLAFFSAMNDYGYPPWTLFGIGYTFSAAVTWPTATYAPVLCTQNYLGEAEACGYACPHFQPTTGRKSLNDYFKCI